MRVSKCASKCEGECVSKCEGEYDEGECVRSSVRVSMTSVSVREAVSVCVCVSESVSE